MKMLKEEGGGKVRLSKTVVGSLISTLFFNYQKELTEKPFELGISLSDKSKRKKGINELDKKIDRKSFAKEKVLEKIKLLNKSSHVKNSWFFREVLAAIVNDEERFNKLKAVCTAICKEKVEELLEGAKVHEDVVDVLKFFGVDPLALEKSMTIVPGNSNIVPSRNVSLLQIEDLALTQASCIASPSQQSSTDTFRDPPKISITPTKMVKVLSSVPPGSKAVEKKNKGFMQNNCEQGENGKYNEGNSSHRHSGTVGLINRRLGMPRESLQLALKKRKDRKSAALHRASYQAICDPPSFRELSEASRIMYMKKALDEVVLSYDMLSYRSLYKVGSLQRNLNESIDSSRSYEDEDEQEFNDLFNDSDCFCKYEDAIDILVKGDVPKAQQLLLELVEEDVAPACYAYALVLFKELVKKCDVYNDAEENAEVMREGADNIEEAFEFLEFCMDKMKPASNFLVGMMKAFNVGECSKFMKGPWQNDLINIVNVAKGFEGLKLERSVLQGISSNSEWDTEECGVGMKRKQENIKKMFKYSLYEFVQEMLLEKSFNSCVVNRLFTILSEGDDFPEGLYGYGSTLVRGKIGGDFQKNVEKAMDLLGRASLQGHEGAKLLLGALPFKREVYCEIQEKVESCIRMLEDYIRKSDDSCSMHRENVDKVALCLAMEYFSRSSAFLDCDKGKAEEILRSRNLREKWDTLLHESQIAPGDDSVFHTPPKDEQPLCSTRDPGRSSSSSSHFLGDCSTIRKVPIPTKLSDTSTENQSRLRR